MYGFLRNLSGREKVECRCFRFFKVRGWFEEGCFYLGRTDVRKI